MLIYNIHNIFKLKIEGQIPKRLERFFDGELGYFKTEEKFEPDLKIELVFSIPEPPINFYPNSGRNDEYFYTTDSFSNKLAIFSNKRLVAESGIKGSFLLEDVIEPLMLIHLVKKGYAFLHASAVSDKEGALVFSAFPKTGKTNIAVSLLEKGYSFLSNELVIISEKGEIFSYPRPITLYHYNFKTFPGLVSKVTKGSLAERLKIEILMFLAKIYNLDAVKNPRNLILRALQLSLIEALGKNYPLRAEEIGAKTADKTKFKKIFLLYRDNRILKPEIGIVKNRQLLASQLWADILREKNKFLIKTALSCNYAFPEKKALLEEDSFKLGEGIIYKALENVQCFKLALPEKVDFREISNFI